MAIWAASSKRVIQPAEFDYDYLAHFTMELEQLKEEYLQQASRERRVPMMMGWMMADQIWMMADLIWQALHGRQH